MLTFFIEQTENMIKIAEDLMGPYIWGQYDLLVLPPSFPYGGMENPCLTFVTPTLLVCTAVVPSTIKMLQLCNYEIHFLHERFMLDLKICVCADFVVY